MDVITSRSNPTVKSVRRLLSPKGRRELRQTIVEGPKGLTELVSAEVRPRLVVRTVDDEETATIASDLAVEELLVSPDVLETLADTTTPQSPIVVIDRPDDRPIRHHRTVVLVDVSDPGNVGTILRSAAAFGWDVAVSGATADPWAPKALRAAAGAAFGLHLGTVTDPLEACREAGLVTTALVVRGGSTTPPAPAPVGLLVGSEAHGLDTRIVAGSDHRFTIPMSVGTESLNAAVAASIAMFSFG